MGKKKSEPASFRVEVVKKRVPDSFLYNVRKDKTKSYRFHYTAGRKLVCTSCRRIADVARMSGKPLPLNSREFDSFVAEKDPEMDHLPDCKPDVCADVLKKYSLMQQARKEFALVKVQKKHLYCVLYRLPGDDDRCYRFNLRKVRIGKSLVACSGCLSRERFLSRERCLSRATSNKSNNVNNVAVICRHMTEAGFVSNPAFSHRDDCQPELYHKVVDQFEIVDSKTAQQFLMECFGQADNKHDVDDSLMNTTMLQQDVGLPSLPCKIAYECGRDNRLRSADYDDDDISMDSPTSSTMKLGKRGGMPIGKNEKRDATSDSSTVSTAHVRRSSRLMLKGRDSLDVDEIAFDSVDDNDIMPTSDEDIDRDAREDSMDNYPRWPYDFASSATNTISHMDEKELHNSVSDPEVEKAQPSLELFETGESNANLNDVQNDAVLDALPEEQTLAANIYSTASHNDNPLTNNPSFGSDTTEKKVKTEILEVESTESVNDDDSDIVCVEQYTVMLTRRSGGTETRCTANVSVVEENPYEDIAHETNRTELQTTSLITSQKQPVVEVKTEAAESKPQVETFEPRTKKIRIDENDDDDIIVLGAAGPAFIKTTRNSTNAVVADVRPPELTMNEDTKPLTDVTHVEQRPVEVAVPSPQRISLASYVEVLNTFDFKRDEISITQDGRLIRVEFPRQADSTSLTNSLSYCVEPPESVDIASIRMSWYAGKLTISGENRY